MSAEDLVDVGLRNGGGLVILDGPRNVELYDDHIDRV